MCSACCCAGPPPASPPDPAPGSVSADPVPGFVAAWQAARAARAARSTVSAPDPVAAAKRAQGRADRVAGGMAELRRWLDDQIGQGLAAAGRAGPQPFE